MVIFPVHFEIRGGRLHFQVSLRWPLRVEAGWQLTEKGYLLNSVAQIPESVEILKERSVYAEGTAGEAKILCGLRLAVRRGVDKLNHPGHTHTRSSEPEAVSPEQSLPAQGKGESGLPMSWAVRFNSGFQKWLGNSPSRDISKAFGRTICSFQQVQSCLEPSVMVKEVLL